MQDLQGYPIKDLVDFLSPCFPERMNRRSGFGRSMAIPTDRQEIRKLQEELRSFIGEWIDSGLQPDGSERPQARHFEPRYRPENDAAAAEARFLPPPRVATAIAEYMGGDLIVMAHHDRGLWYAIRANGLTKPIVPGEPLEYPALSSLRRADDAAHSRRVTATVLFLQFFRSDSIFRLMKCRKCQAFYCPERLLRESYIRGWHCEGCRNSAAAPQHVKTTRANARDRWLAFAAEALNQWSPSKDPDKARWIANKVNSRLMKSGVRRTSVVLIQRNSVTKALKSGEIQKRAQMLIEANNAAR